MLSGLCVGVLATAGYAAVVLAALIALAYATFRWPHQMPIVVALACAVYLGVYLRYRIAFGGFPISVLNLLPLLLIVGACSLSYRERGHGVLTSRAAIPAALLAAGLLVGGLVGLARGAELYQVLRVSSTEVCLMVALLAGLLAGGAQRWQKATVTAFYAAAIFAAAQQIVSFTYLVAVGHSIWQAFPFGANVLNLDQALASGLIAGTRDNYIATFIMLPGLTLSVYRLTARDVFVSAIIILAMAVSLSRSMWIAAVLGIALALAARMLSGRMLRPARLVKLVVVVVAVGGALSVVGWPAVSARLQQTGGQRDTSLQIRRAETVQAFRAVTASPLTALAGIGAGVVLPPTPTLIQSSVGQAVLARGDSSSVLENQLLGRWTNFGLLSVFGTVGLLLWTGAAALWTLVRQRPTVDHDLIALGLALPPLLAVSPFSGTLLQLNLSLPFWMLAGTILAALARADLLRRRSPTSTRTSVSSSNRNLSRRHASVPSPPVQPAARPGCPAAPVPPSPDRG